MPTIHQKAVIHLNLYLHEFIFIYSCVVREGPTERNTYKLKMFPGFQGLNAPNSGMMKKLTPELRTIWTSAPNSSKHLIKNSLKRFEFIFVSCHNSFFHLTKNAPITSVFVSVAEILHMTWFILRVKDSRKLRALSAKNVLACQIALRAYVLTC